MKELWRVNLRADHWLIASLTAGPDGRCSRLVQLCRIPPLGERHVPLVLRYDHFLATASQVAEARATFARRGLL